MDKPAENEEIQLVAVLRVLDCTQDEVASILHMAKRRVVAIEEWLRDESLKSVEAFFDDQALRRVVGRELPTCEEAQPKVLVRAGQVTGDDILRHYRKSYAAKAPDSARLEVKQEEDICLVPAGGAAKFFFTYCEPFLFVAKGEASSGRFVEAPFCGNAAIERAHRSGERDPKTIYDRALARYNEEIEYWSWHFAEESCGGVAISDTEAGMLINVLTHNRDALRYYQLEGPTSPYLLPDWPGSNPDNPVEQHKRAKGLKA